MNIKQRREFYNSRTWRNKRKEILLRDNNECQMCKQTGLVAKAQEVHHVKMLINNPELGLASMNLQSLCRRCHDKIHKRILQKPKEDLNIERW